MGWEVFCLGCFLSTTFSLPPSQSRGPLASLRGAAGSMAPRCCTVQWGRCCSPCLLRLLLSGCVLRGAVEAGAASGTRVSAAALGATAALPLRVLRVVLSARSHLPGPPPHGNRPRSSLGALLASERLSRARGALGAPAATSSRGVAVCAHRHLSLRRGRSYFCRGRFSSAPVLTRPQIYFRLLFHFISAPVTNSIITINFIFFKGE